MAFAFWGTNYGSNFTLSNSAISACSAATLLSIAARRAFLPATTVFSNCSFCCWIDSTDSPRPRSCGVESFAPDFYLLESSRYAIVVTSGLTGGGQAYRGNPAFTQTVNRHKQGIAPFGIYEGTLFDAMNAVIDGL